MKKVLLPLFIIFSFPLFSLDIWINGEFHSSYSREELLDYAIPENPLREGSVIISGIIPLFDDVYRIEAYGGRNSIVLEEPDNLLDTLSLIFTDDTVYLSRGDYRFENPSRLDIWGHQSDEKDLMVLYPENDSFTPERLEEFCRFHDLNFIPVPSVHPARDFMNRLNQKKDIPQLVIFPEESLPDLRGKTYRARDYYFTITALFASRGTNKRPMDLSRILGESSHTYSWNIYDYKVFSLFEDYYVRTNEDEPDALKMALVLNRSLKEMGILKVSPEPSGEETDFFLESTGNISLSQYTCYPDFITPLYDYMKIARPLAEQDSLAAEGAEDFLLSRTVQSMLGWKKLGIYPVLDPRELVNPSDPCLLLLNKYGDNGIRLNYSDEKLSLIENWQTLSRLALNSALSINDLIISTQKEEEGAF